MNIIKYVVKDPFSPTDQFFFNLDRAEFYLKRFAPWAVIEEVPAHISVTIGNWYVQ